MALMRMSTRGNFFVKFLSLILVHSFVLTTLAFSAPQEAQVSVAKPDETAALDPDKVVIPKDFGMVKAKFTGKGGKLVINIQDAHCNYEAQTNIANVLEALIKNDNLKCVSVEGADGVIDTSWFKAFPDADVRKEVATYFMKKGEITGPEFLSITTDYNFTLFGAETRDYYIQNLNAFTSSYSLKEATEKYYNQIKSALNKLKSYIYSDDLKLMDAKMADYESKKLAFNEYVNFLGSMTEKLRINIREYDNFFKLISTLAYEKKIDFKVVDKERSTLIDELSKKLAKDALTQLVTQSLAFKTGKISSAEYYDYLKNLATINGFDITARFKNLANYIIYNAVYSKIDNEKLFADIKKIETAIKEKLFQNDDQRTLEKLSRHIDILLGLVNIKLLNEDFDYYKAHREEFAHETFADFLTKEGTKYGLAYEVEPPSDAVSQSIAKLEDFYVIAIKRNAALVDNTVAEMDKEGVKIAVLVTGGFHTEGMCKLLESKGISYMVICPTITKDVATPYIQILTNQRTSFEDILASSVETAPVQGQKQGMLAPMPLTEIIDRAIAKGDPELQGFKARGENCINGWATKYADIVIAHLIAELTASENPKKSGLDFDAVKRQLEDQLTKKLEAGRFSNVSDVAAAVRATFETRRPAFEAALRAATIGAAVPGPRNGTPGTQRAGDAPVLTDEQAAEFNKIVKASWDMDLDKAKDVVAYPSIRKGFTFVLHDRLVERIDEYNATNPATGQLGYIVHPGRGPEHKLLQAHIDKYIYERLIKEDPNALEVLARHELAHLDIFNVQERIDREISPDDIRDEFREKLKYSPSEVERAMRTWADWVAAGRPKGEDQEDFVNKRGRFAQSGLDGCDVTEIAKRMARLAAEKKTAVQPPSMPLASTASTMASYGANEALSAELARLRAEGKSAERDEMIRKIATRRNAINRVQQILTQPYNGYDIIIVSSTTPDEAKYQREVLERLFDGVTTKNGALGNKVCVLSVVDESEGGQIIGQLNTWLKAKEDFRVWAQNNGLAKGADLDEIFKNGQARIAVYHNGGKGERASPATQSLGDSRGAQKLMGTVNNAKGQPVDLELIPAVVLTTVALAASNEKDCIDTYWGNQIAFGTIEPQDIKRSKSHFNKLVVKIPKNAKMKDIYDYGTAILDNTGRVIKFLRNKVLAERNPKTGEFIPTSNPQFKDDLKELLDSPNSAFDYGSFSMSREMHYAFMDYWTNSKKIFDRMKADPKGRSPIARDIEPAFVQIIVPIVNGLEGRPMPKLPTVAELDRADEGARKAMLDEAYKAIIGSIDAKYQDPLKKIYNKNEQSKDMVRETIEFFIRYRAKSTLFNELGRVVGTIDLGEGTHWFAYKRLLDMANEKFLMLSDIIGKNQELETNGKLVSPPLDTEGMDVVRARDARAFRGISDEAVAVFRVKGQQVTLTAEQVREGWKGLGVEIKGSIIQGNCEFLPGTSIINSIVNDSQGLIVAENSYVESSAVTNLNSVNSIVYKVIDGKPVKADKEIVADAFRGPEKNGKVQIEDSRFTLSGQTRMRAPIGYDPKPENEALAKTMSDTVLFGDNKYTFQQIRDMECNRTKNDIIEAAGRIQVLLANGMIDALGAYIEHLASYKALTHDLVAAVFEYAHKSKPESNSRMRTNMIVLCDLIAKYFAKYSPELPEEKAQPGKARLAPVSKLQDPIAMAGIEKRVLLNGSHGITIAPDIYRRDSVRSGDKDKGADLELPDKVVMAAGAAYVKTLAKIKNKECSNIIIAVGRESRPSGDRILNAFITGALLTGATVIDTTMGGKEITSTPIMYFASRYLEEGKLDGVIEVTASHLPVKQNGLKPTKGPENFMASDMQMWLEATHDFIDNLDNIAPKKGTLRVESLKEPYQVLLAAALEGTDKWLALVDQVRAGTISLREAIDGIRPQAQAYRDSKPLAGQKLCADSGFGSMGPIAGDLLGKGMLGADLTDIGAEPDYAKAYHDANPNNPDNLVSLLKTVRDTGSSFGMAFDVDGDRLGIVTRDGKILRGDDISCIIAPVVIQKAIEKAKNEGKTGYKPIIVLNVLCSERLKNVIRDAGGIPIECAVGFNNVKEAMANPLKFKDQFPADFKLAEGQTAEMGIEISSHIMFKENFNADDAFFAIVKLLGILRDEAQKFTDAKQTVPGNLLDYMLNKLPSDYHTGEWRTPMASNAARIEVADKIRDHYRKMQSQGQRNLGGYRYQIRNEIDGIKVDFVDDNGKSVGWLAVRPSGTSPEIVVAINSLENEDVFNMIKNDFFGQMALYKDQINFDGEKESDRLNPNIYRDQAKGFVFEGKRLPSAVEAQAAKPAPAKPRATPGRYAAAAKIPPAIQAQVDSEEADCKQTCDDVIAMRKVATELQNKIVIIALDNNLYAGEGTGKANEFASFLPRFVSEFADGKLAAKVVRGSGIDLEKAIRDAVAEAEKKGLQVKIVTQLNATKTPADIRDKLNSIKNNIILDISLKDENLNDINLTDHYLQVLRLFNLSLKIGYNFDNKDIQAALAAIDPKFGSMTEKDFGDLFAKRILEILPRMDRIDPEAAAAAYKAARQALASL